MIRTRAVRLFLRQKPAFYCSFTRGILGKKIVEEQNPSGWDQAKPFDAIPGPKPLPIIGDAWMFLGGIDFLKIIDKMHKKYGSVVRMQKLMAFGEFVAFTDVRDIEWMFRNEGPWPNRETLASSTYYRHTLRREIFGDTFGLLNGQNEDWASFRTIVNPIMMQPRTTHQYIPLINDIADEMLARVEMLKTPTGETPGTFLDELNKWAFESITAIALDTRLGCLRAEPSEKAQKAIDYITESMKLMLILDFLPFNHLHRKYNTKPWRRFIECQDYFTNMAMELINQASERIKTDPDYAKKPADEKSVFEKLVAIDKQIAIVMILDMLGAGVDTTAKATGAVLYFLAKNTEAQNRLRAELQRLLPDKNTPLTKSTLEEAKYLRACIKEALRIAPIGVGVMRRTTKPMVIGGYQIPTNVMISIPSLYASTKMHYFRDAERYVPERWLRTEQTEKVSAFVSLPFGFGARSCIGMRMASMEIEVLVAKIVRNYAMEWRYKDMRFKQEMLYGIADPLCIKLTNLST